MSVERSRDNRGRSVPGLHTYVGKHPAQNERLGIHGVSERENCVANISKMGKYEICIPKTRVWV